MWSNKKKKNCCCFCLTSATKLMQIDDETNNIIKILLNGFVCMELCKNICIWCKASLNKLNKFIQNARKSQEILYNLHHGNEENKSKSILNITNAKPRLSYHKPNISIKFEENYDLSVNEEEVDCEFLDFNIKEEKLECVFLNEEGDHNLDLKENEVKLETISFDNSVESTNSEYATKKQTKLRKSPTNVKTTRARYVRPKGVFISTDNILKTMKRRRKPIKVENNYSNDDTEDDKCVQKPKKRRLSDEDYVPKNIISGESESSSSESGKIKDHRVFPMECEECEFTLCSRKEHVKHYYEWHPNITYPYSQNETHICHICGVTRTTLGHLREHLTRHGPKDHKCSECDKKFRSDYLMRQHIRRVHAPRKLQCDYCNKLFGIKTDIIKHIKMHIGLKEYKCFICGARFVTNGNLTIHMRYHEKGPKLNNKKKKISKTKTRKNKVTKKK